MPLTHVYDTRKARDRQLIWHTKYSWYLVNFRWQEHCCQSWIAEIDYYHYKLWHVPGACSKEIKLSIE